MGEASGGPLVQQSWQPSHSRGWFLQLTVRTSGHSEQVDLQNIFMSLWGKKNVEAQGLMLDLS